MIPANVSGSLSIVIRTRYTKQGLLRESEAFPITDEAPEVMPSKSHSEAKDTIPQRMAA